MSNDTASAITDLDTYMRDLTDDEARTIREVAARVKARGGYELIKRPIGPHTHRIDLMNGEGQLPVEQ
jgi:predicted ATPase